MTMRTELGAVRSEEDQEVRNKLIGRGNLVRLSVRWWDGQWRYIVDHSNGCTGFTHIEEDGAAWTRRAANEMQSWSKAPRAGGFGTLRETKAKEPKGFICFMPSEIRRKG